MSAKYSIPVFICAGVCCLAYMYAKSESIELGALLKKKKKPSTKQVTVTALYIYPLKSGKGISVDSVKVDRFGFLNDRRWMLIDQKGVFMTQRKLASMALIEAVTDSSGDTLTLSAPGLESITVSRTSPEGVVRDVIETKVWNATIHAEHVAEADAWLNEYFGHPCKLLCMPVDFTRPIEEPHSESETQVVFQDGYPQLIVSEESVDFLNSKLDKKIDARRFRPNIVVKGCEPHEEDTWKILRVGDLVFEGVKLCARCSLPTVDPDTAKHDSGYEPIKTLRTYRTMEGDVMFGMNLINRSLQGTLNVGDVLEITEWRD